MRLSFVPVKRPVESHSPTLLDQVRQCVRDRRWPAAIEEAYVGQVRQYILFHGKRHPRDLGAADVAAFLRHLTEREQLTQQCRDHNDLYPYPEQRRARRPQSARPIGKRCGQPIQLRIGCQFPVSLTPSPRPTTVQPNLLTPANLER